MGELAVLGRPGDTKLKWDPEKPFEVEQARRRFEQLIKEGYRAHRIKAGGNDNDLAEEITEFDPNARRITLSKPMALSGG